MSVCLSVSQSVDQSIYQSDRQSQSLSHSVNQSRSVNHSLSQSINQQNNQSSDEPLSKLEGNCLLLRASIEIMDATKYIISLLHKSYMVDNYSFSNNSNNRCPKRILFFYVRALVNMQCDVFFSRSLMQLD